MSTSSLASSSVFLVLLHFCSNITPPPVQPVYYIVLCKIEHNCVRTRNSAVGHLMTPHQQCWTLLHLKLSRVIAPHIPSVLQNCSNTFHPTTWYDPYWQVWQDWSWPNSFQPRLMTKMTRRTMMMVVPPSMYNYYLMLAHIEMIMNGGNLVMLLIIMYIKTWSLIDSWL